MATVSDLVNWVEVAFPSRLAQPWDAVGLVCGKPDAPVRRALVTVDVTAEVVDDALSLGVDFILAHHPLLLSGVHSVAATDCKGRLLHSLIENSCALMTAHTNADSANPGVSDALAASLGVRNLRPLEPLLAEPMDKLVVFVPDVNADEVLAAMARSGAGAIGNYDRCAFAVLGTGTFRPLPGSDPHIGQVGEIESVAEARLESVVPRSQRAAVVAAIRAAHPYEEPAFDIIELAPAAANTGLGRIGTLAQPVTLAQFAAAVVAGLPTTAGGIRIAGDPQRPVGVVAVCGGSGDSLLGAATTQCADVFVTADLKHHKVSEHLAAGGCAVVDVAHWASEFPWCEQVAGALSTAFDAGGATVSVEISRIVTDPWHTQLRSQS